MDGPSATTRLFLALWPEPGVRHHLLQWRDGWRWPPGAAPVAADKLHLTLLFLGSLPTEQLPELLDGFAVPFEPFELRLGRPVVWHNGIAVLEPDVAPPALGLLHARLEGAALALGLPVQERHYRPHVTMARRAAKATVPATGTPLWWAVRGYALVASLDGKYTVLRHYA